MNPVVSIIIPTFRRPSRAIEAAQSALAQELPVFFEVVLVDNDPAGSALDVLHVLASRASQPVTLVHEPRAGVANARNTGIGTAKGEFIAFLDDDEIAPELWLGELLRVQAETKADVVFGPVSTRLLYPPQKHGDYFSDFFARDPHHAEGLIDKFYGCGCSLIRRAALPSETPFSAERNEIGGEDDLLFQTMQRRGARFAFAPGAYVWEAPETSRVTLAYTLKRAFAYGQGPATKAWVASPRSYKSVAFWMFVGLCQSMFYGAASVGCFIGRTKQRAFTYRRFVEGLGKLFWFPSIKPRFYGEARLPKAMRTRKVEATPA